MANLAVNEAVAVYRKQVLVEYDAGRVRRELERRIEGLSAEDFKQYIAMTIEIDVASDRAEREADQVNLGDSTARQRYRLAVNSAGQDRKE